MTGRTVGGPTLFDAARPPALRSCVGELLTRSELADFAIGRIRLEAVDLRTAELAGVRRLRVLVGVLDAGTLLDAVAAARLDPRVRANLLVLRDFAGEGRLELRSAGAHRWLPDFSVYASDAGVSAGLVGAHYFSTAPAAGAALTCRVSDPRACRALSERFDALWLDGYDVLDVALEALGDVDTAGPPTPASTRGLVRERAPAVGPPEAATPRHASAATPGHANAATPRPRTAPPREVALRLLRLRYGAPRAAGAPAADGTGLADFQADALRRVEAALDRHGGAVLADAVGLGKTFVALAAIERRLAAGAGSLVVVPAATRRQWRHHLRRLEHASDLPVRPAAGPAVRLISHSWLARNGAPSGEFGLVVVDEAHAFRNPDTRRYAALAELGRRAPTLLLTATPVNNSILDLYWLLRLFAGDRDFEDAGVADLRATFEEAHRAGATAPTPPLAAAIRTCVVRRSRREARRSAGASTLPDGTALRFPRRAPPHAVEYRLTDTLPDIHRCLGEELPGLEGAALGLVSGSITGGRELLQSTLLKRLESSVPAFAASLRRQIRSHDTCIRAAADGRRPRPRSPAAPAERDPLQLLLEPLVFEPLPPDLDRPALLAALRRDRGRLKRLLRAAAPALDPRRDPKLAALLRLLQELRGPTIIFTEFRDTAAWLWDALKGRGGVAVIDGAGARISSGPCGRAEVIERFAPRANGRPEPHPRDRIGLLIATDVLSEGLNLQDAADVISYDLPWNPVRLVQRVGRVDRLGSLHREVRGHYFVPEAELEAMLGLSERIRGKLRAAQLVGPADGAVLAEDPPERASASAAIRRGDPALLERIERADDARWSDVAGAALHASADLGPSDAEPAALGTPAAATDVGGGDEPVRAIARVNAAPGLAIPALVTGWRRGSRSALVLTDPDGRCRRADERVERQLVGLVGGGTDGTGGTGGAGAAESADHDGGLEQFLVDAASRWLRARAAAAAPTAPAVRRASRALLRALAAAPAPDPAICRRVDAALDRLRQGAPSATHHGLARALRDAGADPDVADLIGRIEDAIGSVPDRGGDSDWVLVAALALRPRGVDHRADFG